MYELGGAGGGAGTEVVHLRERDRIAAADRIAGNAASVDAAANHEDVEFRLGHRRPTISNIARKRAVPKVWIVHMKFNRMSNEHSLASVGRVRFDERHVVFGADPTKRGERATIGNERVDLGYLRNADRR